jgi:archaellum component FlaF (FlaF/FlaG flagellin family)
VIHSNDKVVTSSAPAKSDSPTIIKNGDVISSGSNTTIIDNGKVVPSSTPKKSAAPAKSDSPTIIKNGDVISSGSNTTIIDNGNVVTASAPAAPVKPVEKDLSAKISAIVKRVQDEEKLIQLYRSQYSKENKGAKNEEIKPQLANVQQLEQKILDALRNELDIEKVVEQKLKDAVKEAPKKPELVKEAPKKIAVVAPVETKEMTLE